MKKLWFVLGNGFLFVSLWLSVVTVLGRFRLFSYAQTPIGLHDHLDKVGFQDLYSDLFSGFFIAVVIAYAFWVLKRQAKI